MKKTALILWIAPLILLALSLGLRALDPPLLEDVRHRVFDTYQRLKPRVYTEVPVTVVDIDDQSLAQLGQWPWPRTLVARLVTRLRDLGAATIAFDVVFAEPDRTSPVNLLSHLPKSAGNAAFRSVLKGLPSHDQIFADAIAQAPVVTGFALTQGETGTAPIRPSGIAVAGKDPKTAVPEFTGAVINLPAIEGAARGNGALNAVPERDGIVRRVPLLFRLNDRLYPSMAIEGLRVALGQSTFIVKASGASREASFSDRSGVVSVKIGGFIAPTDAAGRIWLYETELIGSRRTPAWKVLSDTPEAGRINGAIVLIGTSAAALGDLRNTALHPTLPGVEIQAQVIEQILTQTFLNRPDWADGAEMLLLLLFGLTLTGLLATMGPIMGGIFGGVVVVASFAGSWYGFTQLGFLLDPVYPVLIATIMFLSSAVLSYLVTERQRRRLRNAFGHYVSGDLVDTLVTLPELELGLGGETREITVLISDIRKFTSISERLDAAVLTRLINGFLTPMSDIIMDRDGTIDKFMGDSIMAFWNAPLTDPLHVSKACGAALAMLERLESLNKELVPFLPQDGGPPIDIRVGIGIATGECCVGNFGSEERFDYSVIGDTVNLSSRLEGMTKLYGTSIIVSEDVHDATEGLAMIELDLVRVVGKTQAVRIFALLGDSRMVEEADFKRLKAKQDAFLLLYRNKAWEAAREALEECQRIAPHLRDLYAMYRARIDELSVESLPPNWDGVHDSVSK